MAQAIDKSEDAEKDLHLASKVNFARSVGIEARTRVVKPADPGAGRGKSGRPERVFEVKDPAQAPIFDLKYREFRETYFGTNRLKHLNARRQEIKKEIVALRQSRD